MDVQSFRAQFVGSGSCGKQDGEILFCSEDTFFVCALTPVGSGVGLVVPRLRLCCIDRCFDAPNAMIFTSSRFLHRSPDWSILTD